MILAKVLFFLAASGVLLVPSEVFALESCGSEVYEVGTEIVRKNNSVKVVSIEMVRAHSDLKEDFVKALYEAESAAKIEILRFLNGILEAREIEFDGKRSTEYRYYHPVKISEPPDLVKQLSQMVVISKCHINHEFVQIRVELSSKH